MFRFLCLLFCLLLPFPVLASPALLADGQDFDFGSVMQGESVTHTFRFQNSGDDILEISSVRSSCGCTAALVSARRIAPGDIGELKLTFDSQGFRGKIHKTIEMTTNDPSQPVATFTLIGTVDLEVFASPERVNWGAVKQPQTLSSQIVIHNRSTQVVKLQPIKIIGKGIKADSAAKEIPPGGEVAVDITAEFADNTGRISGYVIIPTDFALVPQIRVPIAARLSKK